MHTPLCVLRYLGLMVVVVSRLSDRLTEAYGDQTQEQIAERARRAGHQIDRSMISKALAVLTTEIEYARRVCWT